MTLSKPRSARRMAAAVAMTVFLAACGGDPEYNAHDIEGVMPDLAFELQNENAEAVTAREYDGRLKMMFFGYTYCPDICPATMARVRAALAGLDPEIRDDVDVLFVSVDPQRDDPERLRQFTSNFGERFVGLTGTQDQLKTLARRYRTTYGYGEPNDSGFYLVSHSSAIFVFGPDGRARLLANQDENVDALREDIRRLLDRVG